MPIRKLIISNVGVFRRAEFSFDARVNVFVGPNNGGKTTALCALADIAVQPFEFPRKHIRKGSKFTARLGKTPATSRTISGPLPIDLNKGYWSAKHARPLLAAKKQLGFCTFFPALRVGTDFRSKGAVTKKDSARMRNRELYERLAQEEQAARRSTDVAAAVVRDDIIIQELIALDYQAYREDRPEVRETINRIASICSQITEGFPVTFAGVSEDTDGLYPAFKTPDGKVPLSVLSQGTQGLLLWLTSFVIGYSRYYSFPKSFKNKPAILIVDEIDAHLHPSWQRRIIPELLTEFPALQIFCSTHSPLMIAGLEKGQVQLLSRDAQGQVIVSRNESEIRGWSADEIYSCFLGVEHPTDLQTDNQLERLNELRHKKKLSSDQKKEVAKLRNGVGASLRNLPHCDSGGDEAAGTLDAAADDLLRQLEPVLTNRSRKVHARRSKGS